jgi:hypothetical protein
MQLPGVGLLQEWQGRLQAFWQQTPSVQKPLAHWSASVHLVPRVC